MWTIILFRWGAKMARAMIIRDRMSHVQCIFPLLLHQRIQNCVLKEPGRKHVVISQLIYLNPTKVCGGFSMGFEWACKFQTCVTRWVTVQHHIPACVLGQLMYSITRAFSFSAVSLQSYSRTVCCPQVTSAGCMACSRWANPSLHPVALMVLGDNRVAESCERLPSITPTSEGCQNGRKCRKHWNCGF